MSSVINYICSPGIGHLDNSLPIIVELKKYTKKKSNIFFVKESLVNHLMNNPTLHNIHKKTFNKNYIQVKGTISTNNAAARTAFVEGGHGLGRIPIYDALPKIKAGTLETILEDYHLSDIDVYGVFPQGGAESKKLRLLIDYLKAYFKKQLI